LAALEAEGRRACRTRAKSAAARPMVVLVLVLALL